MPDSQLIQFDAEVDAKSHGDFSVRKANGQFVLFQVTERSDTRFNVQPIQESMPGCAFVGLLLLAVSAFACFKFIEPFVTGQSHDEWVSKLSVAVVAGGLGFMSAGLGLTGILSITRMLIDSEKREIQLAQGRGRRVQSIGFKDVTHVRVHVDQTHRVVVSLHQQNTQVIRLPWIGSIWNEGGLYPFLLAMVIASRTGCSLQVELPLIVMKDSGRMPAKIRQLLAELHLRSKPPIDETFRPRVNQFLDGLASIRKTEGKKQPRPIHTRSDVERKAERRGAKASAVPIAEVADGADESESLEPIDLEYDEAITGDLEPAGLSIAGMEQEAVAEQVAAVVGKDAKPLATFKLRTHWYHNFLVLAFLGFFMGMGFGSFAYIELTGIKPVPHLQMLSMSVIGLVLALAIPKPKRWVRVLLYENDVIRVSSGGIVQCMPLVAVELFQRGGHMGMELLSALTHDSSGTDSVRIVGAESWRFLSHRPAAINLQRLLRERCPNAIFLAGDGNVLMPPRPADWRETDWAVLMRRWLRRSFGAEINYALMFGVLLLLAGVGVAIWIVSASSSGQIESDSRQAGKGGMLAILLMVFGGMGIGVAGLQWIRYRRLFAMLNAPRPDDEFVEITKTGHLKYTLDRPRPTIVTAGESALTVVSLPLVVIPFVGLVVAIIAFVKTYGKEGPWIRIAWISLIGSIVWSITYALAWVIDTFE